MQENSLPAPVTSQLNTIMQLCRHNLFVLLTSTGRILYISPSFEKVFGYTNAQLYQQDFRILFTAVDLAADRPGNELRQVLSTGQCSDNNFIVHQNRDLIWVNGESVLLPQDDEDPYILKLIQDTNSEKEIRMGLDRLTEFNETILEGIDDMVVVLDEELQLLRANESFYKLFAERSAAVLTRDFGKLIESYDTSRELMPAIRAFIASGESCINRELLIRTPAGVDKVFDVSCRSVEWHHKRKIAVLIIHDITVQKKAEREREDIIAFVAHELRNPLANIKLCNDLMLLLQQDHIDAAFAATLARSQQNVLRLNHMITELCDATISQAGKLGLEISTFDFDEMVEEAIDTVQVLHPDFSIVVQNKPEIFVSGDRYRIIQVLTNFLSNAIKYSDGTNEAYVDVVLKDESITVMVEDKGMGIPAEQLSHLFRRFFRVDTTRYIRGMGLGLYLSRRIIEMHGGKVWVESEEGKGSRFYFSIPIRIKN